MTRTDLPRHSASRSSTRLTLLQMDLSNGTWLHWNHPLRAPQDSHDQFFRDRSQTEFVIPGRSPSSRKKCHCINCNNTHCRQQKLAHICAESVESAGNFKILKEFFRQQLKGEEVTENFTWWWGIRGGPGNFKLYDSLVTPFSFVCFRTKHTTCLCKVWV